MVICCMAAENKCNSCVFMTLSFNGDHLTSSPALPFQSEREFLENKELVTRDLCPQRVGE